MYTGSLEPFSNRGDWKSFFLAECKLDDGSVDNIDLTGCTVVIALSTDGNCGFVLQGGTASGEVTILEWNTNEPSVISWSFPVSRTPQLRAGTYKAGITISNNDQTIPLFIGTVAVLDGNVP